MDEKEKVLFSNNVHGIKQFVLHCFYNLSPTITKKCLLVFCLRVVDSSSLCCVFVATSTSGVCLDHLKLSLWNLWEKKEGLLVPVISASSAGEWNKTDKDLENALSNLINSI